MIGLGPEQVGRGQADEYISHLQSYINIIGLFWNNLQREATQYWESWPEIRIRQEKLFLNEDSRLGIMAYCIIQSKDPARVFTIFKAVENFINYENFEEAAPISTLETAFSIILLEYSEIYINNKHLSRRSDKTGEKL